MNKTHIELSVEEYQNIHLMLHNLIELTDSLSKGTLYAPEQYQEMMKNINEPLKTVKKTLEYK